MEESRKPRYGGRLWRRAPACEVCQRDAGGGTRSVLLDHETSPFGRHGDCWAIGRIRRSGLPPQPLGKCRQWMESGHSRGQGLKHSSDVGEDFLQGDATLFLCGRMGRRKAGRYDKRLPQRPPARPGPGAVVQVQRGAEDMPRPRLHRRPGHCEIACGIADRRDSRSRSPRPMPRLRRAGCRR